MIKTITDLRIGKWRDPATGEVSALSLTIMYTDEHGAHRNTDRITQSSVMDLDVREDPWEDILECWHDNKPSWNMYHDDNHDWELLERYVDNLTDEQADELLDAQALRYEPMEVIRLLRGVRDSLTETGLDTFMKCLKYNIPLDQVRKEYEGLANLRKRKEH